MYSFSDVWPVIWDGDLPLRGKLWFCETSTTTSKNIFDKDGTALVNPILTNADGRTNVQVLLDGDYTVYMYRYIGTDPLMDDADPDNWLLLYDESIVSGVGSSGSISNAKIVDTIADLEDLEVSDEQFSAILLGYYAGGDKPLVTYTWYPNSTSTVNAGSVVASNNSVTGRWILTIPNIIDVRDFGVFPDLDWATKTAYTSQLTAAFSYSNLCGRGIYFPSVNRSVGSSYYTFEGGGFSTTKKVKIDDNVYFIAKNATTTTLDFQEVEKDSKYLIDDNTDHTNGIINFSALNARTSWRGTTLFATFYAFIYTVDSNATIEGLSTKYSNVYFDGTTGLHLNAKWCDFVDTHYSFILDDSATSQVLINTCVHFKVSYLAGGILKNCTLTNSDVTLDAPLADVETLPSTGIAYSFVGIQNGTIAAGYFSNNLNEYKASWFKTAYDMLTNRVNYLDLEGRSWTASKAPDTCLDPNINSAKRYFRDGSFSVTGAEYSLENLKDYFFTNVQASSIDDELVKITVENGSVSGATINAYSVFAKNSTLSGVLNLGTGFGAVELDKCSLSGITTAYYLTARDCTFNSALTVGSPTLSNCNLYSGITIDGTYTNLITYLYKDINTTPPDFTDIQKQVHVISGAVLNCSIAGNCDILPSHLSLSDYTTIISALEIGYNRISGDFTSSLVVDPANSRTQGFIREWVGSSGSLCSLDNPNKFRIHDNVKYNTTGTNFYNYGSGYIANWGISTDMLHQTELEIYSSDAISSLIPTLNNYMFKLCNDYFDPETTTVVPGQTYGSKTTNVLAYKISCNGYSPLRYITGGQTPPGYHGGTWSSAEALLKIVVYPVNPATIIFEV